MNHAIVIPAINPDNLNACLASMDDDTRDRCYIIDNTDDRACGPVAAVSMGRNLGVATSWNLGARWAFGQGAQFVTLCSSSMRFPDGGRALCNTADFAADHNQWPYGFESLNGWHLFTIGRATWETVGEFDERFWPAYFEDNDYIWRMRCAGILPPAGPHSPDRKIPWLPHINYPSIGDGHAIKSGAVTVDLAALEAKYVEKWGGKPGEEMIVRSYLTGGVIAAPRCFEVQAGETIHPRHP